MAAAPPLDSAAVRRFVLGTAGHVDHGKTALVRALTGVETDRLPEEKRRGITIELGFAPWDLGDGIHVSVIDVPGHRRLVHTMIAGATGMELVLLVIAADEGVMPQTREHVAACELLGIKRCVVAITKTDRSGDELAQLAGEEARELLGDRFQVDVAYCSARTGAGIDDVRATVKRALSALGPPAEATRARLSIDRAFSVRGAGTVVTGTLVEGQIAMGAPLFVVGEQGRRETSARGLHVHDAGAQVVQAPSRLALNLAGLALEEVHRGEVVTDDPRVSASKSFDVVLRAEAKLRPGATASLYVGTARTTARVDPVGPAWEGEGLARLRLHRPLVAVGGDRFVLRGSDVEGPSGAVLGGGEVLDARPPRHRPRAKRLAVLEALRAADLAAVIRALVAEAAPRPLLREALASRFPLKGADLERSADKLADRGELVRLKTTGFIERAALVEIAIRARALVAEHHQKAPLDRGLGRETLRRRLAMSAGVDAAEEAMRIAARPLPRDAAKDGVASADSEPIVIDGDVARLESFTSSAPGGAVATALDATARAITDAGLKGVSESMVRESTQLAVKETRAILARLVRDNVALHAGELWFSRVAVDELRARIITHFEGEKRLTIAQFKEMSGLGRKQTIVLLELFDREGVTRREGDDRFPPR